MKSIVSDCLLTLSHKFIFLLNTWDNYIFSKIQLWNLGKKIVIWKVR